MPVCMCVWVCVWVCVCVCVCMYVHVCVYVYTCMHNPCMCAGATGFAVKEEFAHISCITFIHTYASSSLFLVTAGASYDFELDDLTVTEGVNMSVSPRLRIVSVPSGGVQGLIEVSLSITSSGASESVGHLLQYTCDA